MNNHINGSQTVRTQSFATTMGQMRITEDQATAAVDAIRKARAASTLQAHDSRLAGFTTWLAAHQMQLIDGVPVPAAVIVMYLCDRWGSGRKLNTVDADLASICHWHVRQGMPSPMRDTTVQDCIAGLKRKTAESIRDGAADRMPVRADAAIVDVIRRIIVTIDEQAEFETIRLRDRAMLLMGFAMGARRGEIAALRTEHIQWDAQGIIVSIWAGKTGDRQAEIQYNESPSRCAIVALREWMRHAGITTGPIFRQITITPRGNRKAVISTKGISGQVVNRTIQKWADAAKLPAGRWTSHALRAGFIVQGILDRVPESELRAQTGHKSAVFNQYAQRAKAFSMRRNASL